MWEMKTHHELLRKRGEVLNGGGAKRIEQQHKKGKLTARERVLKLFDLNTFIEINSFSSSHHEEFGLASKKVLGDGVITGYGKIGGRLVFVASQDFTVIGGSLGEMQAIKICDCMDKAITMKAPFVFINDSGGARIEEGVASLDGYAKIFLRNTKASGVIPQIALIMGPCAGGACYSPAICDFIFMVENKSQMFITGPEVVKSVTGEIITSEELGGASVHTKKSGVAHFSMPDDETCLEKARQLISYLPQSEAKELLPVDESVWTDKTVQLYDIVSENKKKAYDVHDVINILMDFDSFFEIHQYFAQNIVIGFARLSGRVVAIVANQPTCKAGSLDFDASDKAARFIRFCDAYGIPLLTLVDVPAFLPGSEQEHSGIIRHGAKLLYAYAEATVPKVTLIMRKAYGGAYIAMNSKGLGADTVFAWPIAEIAVMGADGAANIIFRNEIKDAENPSHMRAQKIDAYEKRFMNPYVAAELGYVDEVILPTETRHSLIVTFDMLTHKCCAHSTHKHGNIPL